MFLKVVTAKKTMWGYGLKLDVVLLRHRIIFPRTENHHGSVGFCTLFASLINGIQLFRCCHSNGICYQNQNEQYYLIWISRFYQLICHFNDMVRNFELCTEMMRFACRWTRIINIWKGDILWSPTKQYIFYIHVSIFTLTKRVW